MNAVASKNGVEYRLLERAWPKVQHVQRCLAHSQLFQGRAAVRRVYSIRNTQGKLCCRFELRLCVFAFLVSFGFLQLLKEKNAILVYSRSWPAAAQ